jgi:hypothetical protein
VGSTAVPGLAAKPILDVDVVVPSAASVGSATAALESLGYVHRGDLGIAGREAFAAPAGSPYHHLYLVVDGSPPYRDHVDLRDLLRRDASARERYAAEKHRLAPLLRTDREAYVEQKGVVVEDLLRQAREAVRDAPGMARDALDEVADYRDRFQVEATGPDDRTAEEWARAALEGMPAALRALVLFAHRRLLRFELGPLDAADHVLGWRIVSSEHDAVRLAAEGPLIRAVLVGRRTGAGAMVLRTFVHFRRGRLSRATWFVVGPVHRRVAPYLLARAARSR